MRNKLKIAIYSGDIPSTTFIERLIDGISGQGHHVYLFGYKKRKVSYTSSVTVIAYTNTKLKKAYHLLKYSLLLLLFKYKEKKKLDSLLRSQSKTSLYTKVKCYPVLWYKPDIFHLQWAKGIDNWIWVQEFGIKLVLSLRGAHINYSPIADLELALMYQKNFPKLDGFHAVSKAIAKEAEKYSANKEKIKVVYSGLDIQPFDESLQKNEKETIEIISIGREHWKKGYSYALDACKILKELKIDFKYTIVGAAADVELMYQIQDLDLSAQVVLLNQVPFDHVQKLIGCSDLLLLPSVEEGIANVVLEAMALGTLVLTTNCGGMNEVVKDGENGFVVPIRNSKRIAEKIKEISDMTKNQKLQITRRAVKTIETQHGAQQMVDGMLDLYSKIY